VWLRGTLGLHRGIVPLLIETATLHLELNRTLPLLGVLADRRRGGENLPVALPAPRVDHAVRDRAGIDGRFTLRRPVRHFARRIEIGTGQQLRELFVERTRRVEVLRNALKGAR
jgi:hypothetical protein